VESSCKHGNEPSDSIKCWETTEFLNKLWPLEWYSAPQSLLVIEWSDFLAADPEVPGSIPGAARFSA
jgi:hypothetical protein